MFLEEAEDLSRRSQGTFLLGSWLGERGGLQSPVQGLLRPRGCCVCCGVNADGAARRYLPGQHSDFSGVGISLEEEHVGKRGKEEN